MPIASCGPRPGAQPHDVQRVDHRRDQRQRLAVPELEAAGLQGQHADAGHRERHGEPRHRADPVVQQHGGQQRREHDVQAGDEPGHRRRRCGPGRPSAAPARRRTAPRAPRAVRRDSGDSVRSARGNSRSSATLAIGNRTARKSMAGIRSEQVLDQEERRPPGGRHGQQRERGQPGGLPLVHAPTARPQLLEQRRCRRCRGHGSRASPARTARRRSPGGRGAPRTPRPRCAPRRSAGAGP